MPTCHSPPPPPPRHTETKIEIYENARRRAIACGQSAEFPTKREEEEDEEEEDEEEYPRRRAANQDQTSRVVSRSVTETVANNRPTR